MPRSGADLALLLLGGFRALVDDAIEELAQRGYEDVRPVHDFPMRAIAAGADNASELGRRLSVSKRAAAKTVAGCSEHAAMWDVASIRSTPAANDSRSRRSVSRSCER